MKLAVVFIMDEDGWVNGYAEGFPHIVVREETIKAARARLVETVRLVIRERREWLLKEMTRRGLPWQSEIIEC